MKIKIAVSLVLAFLLLIFIAQNTETVRVAFLVWAVEMSRVLLLFIMLGAGIALGLLLPGLIRVAGQAKREKGERPR
jgi:uncharacterized integral membrane protein